VRHSQSASPGSFAARWRPRRIARRPRDPQFLTRNSACDEVRHGNGKAFARLLAEPRLEP
jgi:hypothetical protein